MIRKIVLRDAEGWLVFERPLDVITARNVSDVLPALVEAEQRVITDSLFAAGFVSYEAASGFDEALKTHSADQTPLLCLGLFGKPRACAALNLPDAEEWEPLHWQMAEMPDSFARKINEIKRQIGLGNTYQVNYTMRQYAKADIVPWDLFLRIASDVPYATYIDCDDCAILSASPELFFQLDGDQLTCRPMKGTAPRAMTQFGDMAKRRELKLSSKNRAENIMITDMIRNDLGRIARAGSVDAPSIFDIEKLRTVWQMTSTVTASSAAPVSEIFRAMFPCASITGAPKVASMAIIKELEDTPRGVYTGAIGYFGPGRRARFSVAIRTATFDKTKNRAVYGTGCGVVWDSEAADEYCECISKARILTAPYISSGEFELIETMLWKPDDGFVLLNHHLKRLQASATYFDFICNITKVKAKLLQISRELSKHQYRVRLSLERSGGLTVSVTGLRPVRDDQQFTLGLAKEPIDKNNPFMYHKSTRREVYERAMREADGVDDVLLWNEDGFITETTTANVALQLGGEFVTPPVDCGLLGGTYRAQMLERGEVKERKIRMDELATAKKIILMNSVRGAYSATVSLV